MRKLIITFGFIITIPFTSAFAQMGGDMPVFADLDADKNGSLNMEEMAVMPARRGTPEERFGRFDADSDGSVTEEEFNTFLSNARGGMGGGMGG